MKSLSLPKDSYLTPPPLDSHCGYAKYPQKTENQNHPKQKATPLVALAAFSIFCLSLPLAANAADVNVNNVTDANAALNLLPSENVTLNITDNITSDNVLGVDFRASSPISGNLVINGGGHTLRAYDIGNDNRAFYIGADGLVHQDSGILQNVTVSNLTITGANFASVSAPTRIYGANGLSGFAADATLTLNNVTFTDNKIKTASTTALAAGAGLLAYGNGTLNAASAPSFVLKNVNFTGNIIDDSTNTGAGAELNGAGLTAAFWDTVKYTGGTVSDNVIKYSNSSSVGFGAGLYLAANNDVTIEDVSFFNNVIDAPAGVVSAGGAIYADATSNTSTLTIKSVNQDVVFSGNVAVLGAAITAQRVNVVFDAAAGRKIVDNDGTAITGGNFTKVGAGTAEFLGDSAYNDSTSSFGSLVVNGNAHIADGKVIVDKGFVVVDLLNSGTGNVTLGDSAKGTTGTLELNAAGANIDIQSLGGLITNVITGNLIDDGGKLVIYGDIADNDAALTVMGTNGFEDRFSVTDSFTDYAYVATGAGGTAIRANGTASSASIADGYLALASIHNFNTGYQAVQDHLISGRARRLGFLGQSQCEEVGACNPCDPCGVLQNGGTRSAWVNYVGRSNQYFSNTLDADWNIRSNGVQVGADLYRTNRNQFGVLFGYEKSDSANGLNNIDGDDTYFGFYAAHVFSGGADARVVGNFGWQNYDLRRWSRGAGQYFHSSLDGKTTELNLELGKRFYCASNNTAKFSFRPVGAIDLNVFNVDGAAEDGFDAATPINSSARYNGLSYTQTFLRLGSDFQLEGRRAKFNGGLYYSYDLNDNTLKASVSGIRGGNPVDSTLYGSDLGRQILTVNLSGAFALTNRFDIYGGFTGNAYIDRAGTPFQSTGYAGGAVRW
ncbi:hypothetical protein FACS18942_05290 [Planctomycetales bacterium]|nr:hypothetical protein FACS18942_05290 [Planctomycetales bacterium]